MELKGELLETMTSPTETDYWAEGLLEQIDTEDLLALAFAGQDEARKVGFDFKDAEDTLPRALDEIRETREAHDDYRHATPGSPEATTTLEHLGDEIADLVFSGVNLARHRGRTPDDFPALDEIEAQARALDVTESSPGFDELIRDVETAMHYIVGAASKQEIDQQLDAILIGSARLAHLFGLQIAPLVRGNVRKYLIRCKTVEDLAAENGLHWEHLATEGLILKYWKRAKQQEQAAA